MLLTPTNHPRMEEHTIAKMDAWLTALAADGSEDPVMQKIARAKPADLVDACYTQAGERIVEPQTFSGGECNKLYPTFPSPRMIAGGPVSNDVLKCQLKPVDMADYQALFSQSQRDRLSSIFPQGVCDWSKPGVAQVKPGSVWQTY
jgi:hypothetical protein